MALSVERRSGKTPAFTDEHQGKWKGLTQSIFGVAQKEGIIRFDLISLGER
jgi:hypothetical protein